MVFIARRWHPARDMTRRPALVVLSVLLASASVPARAGAQPAGGAGQVDMSAGAASEGEKATSAVPLSNDPALEYKLGEQAYALGKYEQAIAHFERSYQLSNHPYLLYNLGMAYGQWYGLSGDVGHLRHAKRLFQNYLKVLAEDPSMDQEQRGEAEAQIARLDEQIAEHEARLRAEAAAEGPRVEPPVTGPVDQPPDRPPVYKRGWFWAVIGVGVLAVAGGVTAAVLVSRRDDGAPAELGTIGPTRGQAPAGLGFRF
jgi:tetratricopeptide (TPR) repeat protein